MACRAASVGGCGRMVVCSGGLINGAPSELRGLARAAPVGSVWNRIVGDTIYYVYRSTRGGGFIVEASMDGLASGMCGPRLRETLVPLVEELLSDDPLLPFLVMMIEEKMLR